MTNRPAHHKSLRGSARKSRLDERLVCNSLATNRTQAVHLIMSGRVLVNDRVVQHPGRAVAHGANVRVKGPQHPWVSRGGIKLAHALNQVEWRADGRVVLDIGASTGGFTDVLLQYGARRVIALDVGQAQLHWRLRQDSRVTVIERTNARTLTAQDIHSAPIDMIVCDVSFISATKVLPPAFALLCSREVPSRLVVLVKPQFEVGRERVGKGGIVRQAEDRGWACQRVEDLVCSSGWKVRRWVASTITGADGNQEYLLCAEKQQGCAP